jgi:hypothetical protein
MLQRYRYRQRITARRNQILTGAKRIEYQDRGKLANTSTSMTELARKEKFSTASAERIRLRWGPPSGGVAARCPDFLYAAQATATCAAFIEESRIKLINANKSHRKSGGVGPRTTSQSCLAVVCLLFIFQMLSDGAGAFKTCDGSRAFGQNRRVRIHLLNTLYRNHRSGKLFRVFQKSHDLLLIE